MSAVGHVWDLSGLLYSIKQWGIINVVNIFAINLLKIYIINSSKSNHKLSLLHKVYLFIVKMKIIYMIKSFKNVKLRTLNSIMCYPLVCYHMHYLHILAKMQLQ